MSKFALIKTRDIQKLRGLAEKRAFSLNDKQSDPTGDYVLYWTQMTQRTQFNFALQYAIRQANRFQVPLVVYHGLNEDYPYASLRIHTFILQGVKELYARFKKMGIHYGFYLAHGKKQPALLNLIKKAVCVVSDDYPSFVTPVFNKNVAAASPVAYTVVDSSTTIPFRYFHKQEWSAATIRTKIHKVLPEVLEEVFYEELRHTGKFTYPSYFLPPDFSVEQELARLKIDTTVSAVSFCGGEDAAQKTLHHFIANDLDTYNHTKNDPSLQRTSHLSAYLHFGMISPIDIVLQILKSRKLGVDSFLKSIITPDAVHTFLEELIVRRDLAYNFCHTNPHHASLRGVPSWGKKTLQEHGKDARPYLYTREVLEQGKTHDPYWNAAQLEMVYSGKMHGYMRMYWCKKILEWTKNPKEAFSLAVYFNDKYALDGRDPNGYAGIAWALGGLHDRPWFTKPIFGKVRTMQSTGLERKFPMQRYLAYVQNLITSGINSKKP